VPEANCHGCRKTTLLLQCNEKREVTRNIWVQHNILQARASRPFLTVQNNIQDPPPRWILTIFKLKFGGWNLFSPAMTNTIEGNNSVGLGACKRGQRVFHEAPNKNLEIGKNKIKY
jgi:hypothetical protein